MTLDLKHKCFKAMVFINLMSYIIYKKNGGFIPSITRKKSNVLRHIAVLSLPGIFLSPFLT